MHIELLYHTPEPERAVAAAARLCYSPVGASQLMESMDDDEVRKILRIIIKGRHFSALEHASFTFAIDGVSRALTHQLVRHRLASFNQQSQRYVNFDEGFEYIEPKSIKSCEKAHELFVECMEHAQETYKKLREIVDETKPPDARDRSLISKEDARFVLPNAAETKIVVTMNIRELYHFFELRCCRRAQWEIRELALRMLDLVKPCAPYIFLDAGAPCVFDVCHEGAMTCGNPYPKVRRD